MIAKHITYGCDGLIKGTIISDSGVEYISSIDIDSSITWCTCPQYVFHKQHHRGQTPFYSFYQSF